MDLTHHITPLKVLLEGELATTCLKTTLHPWFKLRSNNLSVMSGTQVLNPEQGIKPYSEM